MKSYKKLPIDTTPTPPSTLTRITVRCPLTRERGVRRGWGVRGGMGVREGGTSWVWGYVGGGRVCWGGGGGLT